LLIKNKKSKKNVKIKKMKIYKDSLRKTPRRGIKREMTSKENMLKKKTKRTLRMTTKNKNKKMKILYNIKKEISP